MPTKPRAPALVADHSPQAIASRIREALAALHGVSERELARRCGFAAENHVNTLLRRLDAGRSIEVDTLVALGGALHRSLDWLATGLEAAAPTSGTRLRDAAGWPAAEAEALRRGCGEGAVRAAGETRWPTAPSAARLPPLVVALARAWSDAAD